jgi:hypothetical protein
LCTQLYRYFRRLRFFSNRPQPLVLLLLLTVAGALPAAASEQALASPSLLEIPLRLSLGPLAVAAEEALPDQAGHWRSWKDWHGI